MVFLEHRINNGVISKNKEYFNLNSRGLDIDYTSESVWNVNDRGITLTVRSMFESFPINYIYSILCISILTVF